MATVSGYTAGRTKEIEDSTVVGGTIDQTTKHLMLRRRDGQLIDGGKLDGPKGDKGDPGLGNVNTVNGKFGPDIILSAGDVGALPASAEATVQAFGTTRYATDNEATGLAVDSRALTPKKLAVVSQNRWERKASTVAGLGSGLYAGQLALLTLASNTFPVEVVWTGVRWEPVSWRLSGSQSQRDAFQVSGVCYDGAEWYNQTFRESSVWDGSTWGTNSPGLVPLTSFNASATQGTAELVRNNTIHFENIYLLHIRDLFTPRYMNYKVLINHAQSMHDTSPVMMRFIRPTGVEESSARYYQAGVGYNLNTQNTQRSWNQTATTFSMINHITRSGNGFGFNEVNVYAPAVTSVRTTFNNRGLGASAGFWQTIETIGMYDSQEAHTGFMLHTNADKGLTGDISVYGYN